MPRKKQKLDINHKIDLREKKHVTKDMMQKAPTLIKSQSNAQLIADMFELACREEGRHKVSSKDFKMIRQLGSGAYAKVVLATHNKTRLKCAMKTYPKSKVDKGIRRKAVQQEIACMLRLDNINFPKLYYTYETDKEIVLVQEYITGQPLSTLIKQNTGNKGLPENQAKSYFK